MLETEKDRVKQAEVAARISTAWRCTCQRVGGYSPIDYYLFRDDVLVGVMEIKVRTRRSIDHTTVIMDTSKYLNLLLAEIYLGAKAFFVVSFQDGIWYLHVGGLVPEKVVVKGRTDRPTNDVRPAIMVPFHLFTKVQP